LPRALACRKFAFLLPLLALTLAAQAHPAPAAPDGGPGGPDAPPLAAWDDPARRGFWETAGAGFGAGLYCVLANTIVMYFNGVVTRAPWAFPTPATIRRNLSGPWKWEDTDGFLVNQIGHPVQGSVYFSAGRAHGFGFYGSLFFSAFGSLTWEIFHEGMVSSVNDVLTTIPSSASMGEILWRLYAQARAAGAPTLLAMLFNPAAGVHELLTGRGPPNVEGNLYELRAYIGGGFSGIGYSVHGAAAGGGLELLARSGGFAGAGLRAIYGDPFDQNTAVPFRHFEFMASLDAGAGGIGALRVHSDGYLFSLSPLRDGRRSLSTGLSLHMDAALIGEMGIRDSTINMYANALGWTAKYRHLFPRGAALRSRAHAGLVFFGASTYFCPDGAPLEFHPDIWIHELNNFGFGVNFKHFSTLELGRGRIDVGTFVFFMWPYPGASALERGLVRWQLHDVAFSHPLPRGPLSLGAALSVATERGSFEGFPSTRKNRWSARAFAAWSGRGIRGGS